MSIDELLSPFLQTKLTEKFLQRSTLEKSATLKQPTETLLQGLFHTWIHANPLQPAHEVIQKITQDAAKALIDKHRHLTTGLNLHNLPRGFYTQRSKDGLLILCYNPELGYVTQPNEFTLDLRTPVPKATPWEGDFRQFRLADNTSKDLSHDDVWADICLYSALQPAPDITHTDIQTFIRKNQILCDLSTDENIHKIQSNWYAFIQAWQFDPRNGVQTFLTKESHALQLTPEKICEQLFASQQSEEIRLWAAKQHFSINHLRGLGQVYYRYGDHGLMLLATVLKNLEQRLGTEFFEAFKHSALESTDNFTSYLSVEFFETLNKLMTQLAPDNKTPQKLLFQKVLSLHTRSIGWDKVEKIWEAFSAFIEQVHEMGLDLKGNEFDTIPPQNMLVFLERLIKTLQHIPQQEQKQYLLRNLSSFDLEYGGIHYAVQHDHFKYFDPELKLSQFEEGTPTYAPNLKTLFSCPAAKLGLQIKRTLASQSQFSHDAYLTLSGALASGTLNDAYKLMFLLHTQYDATQLETQVLPQLSALDQRLVQRVGVALHHAVYHQQKRSLAIHFHALVKYLRENVADQLQPLLNTYPDVSFLEALSILEQTGRYTDAALAPLTHLFQRTQPTRPHASLGLKLAALFGVTCIEDFLNATVNLIPLIDDELQRLSKQLFSIDYQQSTCSALSEKGNWPALLACIEKMKSNPKKAASHRIEFLASLTAKGLKFKYSKNGDFRALDSQAIQQSASLSIFVDHSDRIKSFFTQHIAVTSSMTDQEAIMPIVRFLTRLQLNRTYLNEVEPILAALERTPTAHYWHVEYFYGFLRALQPKDEQVAYPISILNVLLQEESIQAKALDHIDEKFPAELSTALQEIIGNTLFNRDQRTLLCQIALRDLRWNNNIEQLNLLTALLSREQLHDVRTSILKIITLAQNSNELKVRLAQCRCFLEQTTLGTHLQPHWFETTALWLKAVIQTSAVQDLFDRLYADYSTNPKFTYLMHILAWSALNQNLKTDEEQCQEISRKINKLAQQLAQLELETLRTIAQHFPTTPSVTATELLRIIKEEPHRMDRALNDFQQQAFAERRPDFAPLPASREKDLYRMIEETRIMKDGKPESLNTEQASRLLLMFGALKRLEEGSDTLDGEAKPLNQLSPVELKAAFTRLNKLAQKKPNDDRIRIQIWAVLFETLGRTTRKYPHLAQQFAIIANDVGINAPSRVLQLATGEGKSNYVALRAARHAGLGRNVDVCTAKRTLAQRDLQEYEAFFRALGLASSYIHPKSPKAAYENTQIHYTTAGDLSLYLAEHLYQNNPVQLKEKGARVALFDEFDFIRFEEGTKTQYNFAIPTGKTPKQMTWFYQATNHFYDKTIKRKVHPSSALPKITPDLLEQFIDHLMLSAQKDEDKQSYVANLCDDPLQLVHWLQSAHEADSLEQGVGFTVRDELIEVGEEVYPMREIVPLSSDNQKVDGSTFSGGVHQLLAARLNAMAKSKGQALNFHIHPASEILSTRVVAELMDSHWGAWEGFSGTISQLQADILANTQGTQVLQVPTNQANLRQWHEPGIYAGDTLEESQDLLFEGMIEQIRSCLNNKQSILFACRDDKQVEWLKTKLEASHLTAEEYAAFIFYTNEDQARPAEVLQKKKQMEAWHGGQKQKGVALVASGFGRGDNVGVEAVFLLYAISKNDLLQKGGRTARNGASGNVYQYYLQDELMREREALLVAIDKLLRTGRAAGCETALKEFDQSKPKEIHLNEVLALREYVSIVQNTSIEQYHYLRSQFSDWGMSYLSNIEDLEKRQELMKMFRAQMSTIEKEWLKIDSEEASMSQKINQLRDFINAQALDFKDAAQPSCATQMCTFSPKKHELFIPNLRATPKIQSTEDHPWSLAILNKLMQILASTPRGQLFELNIPSRLQKIESEHALREFFDRIKDSQSIGVFDHELRTLEQQLAAPSDDWLAAQRTGDPKLRSEELLTHLKPALRDQFSELIGHFKSEHQTILVQYLSGSRLSRLEPQIQKLLPFMRFISGLGNQASAQHQSSYFNMLPIFLNSTQTEWLLPHLNEFQGPSFSAHHLLALAALADKVAGDTETRLDLFQRLRFATQHHPEQSIRMLTKFESMFGTEAMPSAFFHAFCQSMQRFSADINWDQFERLLELTTTEWNKKRKGLFPARKRIMAVWHGLAQFSEDKQLTILNPLLDFCLKQSGKMRMELLDLSLNLPTAYLVQYQNESIEFLSSFISPQQKKSFQLQRVSAWVQKVKAAPADWSVVLERFSQNMHVLASEKKQGWIGCVHALLSSRNTPDVQCIANVMSHEYVHALNALTVDKFNKMTEQMMAHPQEILGYPDLILNCIQTLPSRHAQPLQRLLFDLAQVHHTQQLTADFNVFLKAYTFSSVELLPPDRVTVLTECIHSNTIFYLSHPGALTQLLAFIQKYSTFVIHQTTPIVSAWIAGVHQAITTAHQHPEVPLDFFLQAFQCENVAISSEQLPDYLNRAQRDIRRLDVFCTPQTEEKTWITEERAELMKVCKSIYLALAEDKKIAWVQTVYSWLEHRSKHPTGPISFNSLLQICETYFFAKTASGAPRFQPLQRTQFSNLTHWMQDKDNIDLMFRVPQLILAFHPYLALQLSSTHEDKIKLVLKNIAQLNIQPGTRGDLGSFLEHFISQSMLALAKQNPTAHEALLDLLHRHCKLFLAYPELIATLLPAYNPSAPLCRVKDVYQRFFLDAATEHLTKHASTTIFSQFIEAFKGVDLTILRGHQLNCLLDEIKPRFSFYMKNPVALNALLRFNLESTHLSADCLRQCLNSIHQLSDANLSGFLKPEQRDTWLHLTQVLFTSPVDAGFNELILSEFKELFPTKQRELNSILATWTTHKSTLEKLSPAAKHSLTQFISRNHSVICQTPGILVSVFRHAQKPNYLASLQWVINYTNENPSKPTLERAVTELEKFFASSRQTSILEILQKYGRIESLFDQSARYWENQGDRDTLQYFYTEVTRRSPDPAQIFLAASDHGIFNFEDPQRQTVRRHWMRLLYQGTIIQPDDAPSMTFSWTQAHNDRLFNMGLNAYLKEAKTILSEVKPAPDMNRHADLTHQQRTRLLRLSNEIEAITNDGGAHRPGKAPSQQHQLDLKAQLDQLMDQYDSAWWPKSDARRAQAQKIRTQMQWLFTETPNYSNIYQSLATLKRDIMCSDTRENADRWFMINRSGTSRLFNTLNKMQDRVLETWAQSQTEDFKDYATKLENESYDYLNAFMGELERSVEALPHQVYGFFTSHNSKQAMRNLLEDLNQGQQNDPLYISRCIGEHLPHLPGHLSALGKEVLMRMSQYDDAHVMADQRV